MRESMLKSLAVAVSLSVGAAIPVHPAALGSLEEAAALNSGSPEAKAAFLRRFFDGNRLPGQTDGAAVSASGVLSGQPGGQRQLKEMMLQNLDFVRNSFKAQYAPARWKEQHVGWDLDKEIQKAKDEVKAADNITIKEYQGILRRVILSTRDYHVSVGFASTETSSLPLKVMEARGKFFIVWVDRTKLPETSFPFKPGDELVAFGGKKTADVVREIQGTLGDNIAQTDRALAAHYLTRRRASSLGSAEQGPITVTVRPQGSQKTFTRQLIWDYTPERVTPGPGELKPLKLGGLEGRPSLPFAWLHNMESPVGKVLARDAGNPFGIGNRESFLPPFGAKIWESDKEDTFDAYIYRSPADGKLVGYVRIPAYGTPDVHKALEDFAKVVTRFESVTHGMVIDQINNPGGSVFYLYALVSMLSDQAMATPRHRIAINHQDVAEAAEFLAQENAVKNDEDARKALGETLGGYPVDYGVFRHFVEFSRFILDEWAAGRRLTAPVHLGAVDQINPSPKARYTKPILLLVNELDFSGGDFFPAILQDNKRAKVFGTRTAGAGGFVRDVQFPNQLGVTYFTMTGSLAERVDRNPIENLGVKPDIHYAPTAADVQGGFAGYAKAVNQALAGMLGTAKK